MPLADCGHINRQVQDTCRSTDGLVLPRKPSEPSGAPSKLRLGRDSACAESSLICATPPSTNSSLPVTKLESLDARKRTAVAISSGLPMVPRGMRETNQSTACLGRPSRMGVSMVPGLITLTRIFRALRSTVQVRAKSAALLCSHNRRRGRVNLSRSRWRHS